MWVTRCRAPRERAVPARRPHLAPPANTRRPGGRGPRGRHSCTRAQEDSFSVQKDDDKEATFVPLDAESSGGVGGITEEAFGRLAVLLVGFNAPEYQQVQKFMNDMDADMVPIHCVCTGKALDSSMQQILEEGQPGFQQPEAPMPRAVLLSGMYSSEVVDVVGTYRALDMPRAIFAAAVPNNYKRPLRQVLFELQEDHRTLG